MRHPIEVISYQDTASPHWHQHTQIVLPLSGQLILAVEGQQQAIGVGQACFISQGQAHHHLALTDNRCLVLNALSVWDDTIPSQDNFMALTSSLGVFAFFMPFDGPSNRPSDEGESTEFIRGFAAHP